MNRLLQVRKVTAGLILLAIVSLGLCNMVYAFPSLKETVLTVLDADMSTEEKIATVESQIDAEFFGKNAFIEGYGLVQLALGEEAMEEFTIAKDTDGKLHYVYFQTEPTDVTGIGDAMISLADMAQDAGAECFYLMPLTKTIDGHTTFDQGIPVPDDNQAMDDFLSYIGAAGINSLDLRTTMAESGIPAQEQFYDTDHHWTTETAFWAFTQTVDYLEDTYGLSLDPDAFYTNLDNYNQIVYEDSFLGSMGRTVGAAYGGIDDFTLIYPKFSTNFSHYARNGAEEKITLYGMAFHESLIAAHIFNQDADIMAPESDKYFAYLWGNYGFTQIVNHNCEDGAKILFIKDSLAVPLAAFLSTTCAQVDLIDPRWFDESISYCVENGDYDVVIVSVSASNLIEDFFTFD